MTEVKDVAGELQPEPKSQADKNFETADKYTKGIPVANSGVGIAKGGHELDKKIDDYKKGGAGAPDAADVAMAAGSFVADTTATVAGWAGEIQGIIEDPIGALISAGLDFLLSVCQPLQEALNHVTGDSKSINEAAEKFSKIGSGFDELAQNFTQVHAERTAQWQGDAAEKAAGEFQQFAESIGALSAKSTELSRALSTSGMIMDMIVEVIKSIISSLIEWLLVTWIAALAASIATFGASDAAAAAATPIEGGMAMEKAGTKANETRTLLEKLASVLEKAAEKGGKNVEKAAAKKASKLESKAAKLQDEGTDAAKAAAKKTRSRADSLRSQEGRGVQRRINNRDEAAQKARNKGDNSAEARATSNDSDIDKAATTKEKFIDPVKKLGSEEGRQGMLKDFGESQVKKYTGVSSDVLTGKKSAEAKDYASAANAYATNVKSGIDSVSSLKSGAQDGYTIATEGQSDDQTSDGFTPDGAGAFQDTDTQSSTPTTASTPQSHHVTDWADEEEYPHHSVFEE